MSLPKPGKFAVRAINQYRRRDVLGYLGLRYYLDSASSRSDVWATDIAVDQVLRRNEPLYFKSFHFKDIDSNGSIAHREMFLPSPAESIAEAVLIDACSLADGAFTSASCVYSYEPVSEENRDGIYKNYMHGVRRRHSRISELCDADRSSRIGFYDIQRFYPSVKYDVALNAWKTACDNSNLPNTYRELGEKILFDHSKVSSGNSILTGPMFSHLIGNLVLSKIDEALKDGRVGYIRYVDDVALIGSKEKIGETYAKLDAMLEDLGLDLHEADSHKSLMITADDWLAGRNDFSESPHEYSWMTLIGDLKQLLLWQPEEVQTLKERLQSEDFRIPLLDYCTAVAETSYVSKQLELIRGKWLQKKLRRINVDNIMLQAHALRQNYSQELNTILGDLSSASSFTSKRKLPKVRYRIGQLSYLATTAQLAKISSDIKSIPSLYFQSEITHAVSTGSVDRVVALGTNAAQAAAQPLRMSTNAVTLSSSPESYPDQQSLAIFSMNGIDVRISGEAPKQQSELLHFVNGKITRSMFLSNDPFVKELSCLHGLADTPRHSTVLNTAFDIAEEVTMDAIEQSRASLSL